jgi:ferredoxin
MRVWIEEEFCTGDGLCEELCAEMFEMGDDGLAHVKGCGASGDSSESAVTVREGLEESVLDAEAQCAGECLHTVR